MCPMSDQDTLPAVVAPEVPDSVLPETSKPEKKRKRKDPVSESFEQEEHATEVAELPVAQEETRQGSLTERLVKILEESEALKANDLTTRLGGEIVEICRPASSVHCRIENVSGKLVASFYAFILPKDMEAIKKALAASPIPVAVSGLETKFFYWPQQ